MNWSEDEKGHSTLRPFEIPETHALEPTMRPGSSTSGGRDQKERGIRGLVNGRYLSANAA